MNSDVIVDVLKLFVPIFVVVSPIGLVPLFVGMTQNDNVQQRRRTAWIAACTTTFVLLGASFAGQALFSFFSISLDAFRIAGGILLFLIGLDFVNVRQTRTKTTDPEYEESIRKEEVGIIPLAIPMLAGPGAVATVMVQHGDRGYSLAANLPHIAAIVLLGAVTLVTLLAAVRLQRHLTPTVIGLCLRVEGLLLTAIAVEMVVRGVTNLVLMVGKG
ncbi:MAG: MarC family protein [Planctomycetota bacterium]